MDDTPPLDFGPLKIDQEADRPAGGAQVIQALCSVFVGEPLRTLELDHQHLVDEEISKVFTDVVPLVFDWEGGLSESTDAAKGEFSDKRAFVNFFEESGAQSVRDFKHCSEYLFRKVIRASAFIGG